MEQWRQVYDDLNNWERYRNSLRLRGWSTKDRTTKKNYDNACRKCKELQLLYNELTRV